ncbi:MAG: (Fe-S)-binding protein, partial [Cyanobacteria bacterium]|nr:(Fe-S)-binding protein [Cyanobacteriota bacterium]
KEYALLFDENPTYRHKAEILSKKVVDVMELLHQKPMMPFHRSIAQTVTYHAACHLHHAQGIQKEPIELLSQIPGIHLIPLKNAEACCGSAGVYNVEQPELSQEILDEKLKHVLKTKAEVLVTGNPGCLLQLEAGLGLKNSCMKVMHPIELFAKAYQMEDI